MKVSWSRLFERGLRIEDPCYLERNACTLIEQSERGFDLGLKRLGNRLFNCRQVGPRLLGKTIGELRRGSDANERIGLFLLGS